MSDAKSGKVISADSETAYERWEAPNVHTVEQQKQQKAGLLTANQLEELQKQAYDEGFQLGKDEGYQKAFSKGFDDGFQQGLEQGHEEVEQIVKRFGQIMQFLSRPLEQVNDAVKDELITLSMATAKQIIRREISLDPGQIVAVIKEALAALPSSSKKIRVFLHPADAEIAREYLKISAPKASENDNTINDELYNEFWSIIDEPNITRGGCQIKSEFSQVDASIENRIAEISARILGSERTAGDRTVNDETVNEETETINSFAGNNMTDNNASDDEMISDKDHLNPEVSAKQSFASRPEMDKRSDTELSAGDDHV